MRSMRLTLRPHGLSSPWYSPAQNTGVGSLSLLQGIFPTQGSNPGLPHYTWILYQLSHKRRPRILEWVAYPFSSGSSRPGIEPGSSALQADALPTELSGTPWLLCHSPRIISVCFYLVRGKKHYYLASAYFMQALFWSVSAYYIL